MRIFGKEINIKALGKLLSRHKVVIYREQINKVRQRALRVTWIVAEYDVNELIQQLFTDDEQKTMGLKLVS